MGLKNIVLALGVGMVCIGTLLMFFNGQKSSELSDAEIKRRAEMLGMVESDKNAILTSELEGLKKENADDVDDTNDTDDMDNMNNTDNANISSDEEQKKDLDSDNQEADLKEQEKETDSKTEADNKTGDLENLSKDTPEENTDKKTSGDETSSDKTSNDKTSNDKTSNKKTEKKKTKSSQKTDKKDTKKQKTEEEKKNTITVKINSGMTAGEICRKLEEKGLVKDAEDFRQYLVEKNIQRKLQAGTFKITDGADYDEIIGVIYRG